MVAPPDTDLYHVGCGRPLFTMGQLQQARAIALACRCGANGPIVTLNLQSGEPHPVSLPGSLVQTILGWARELSERSPPHLEYYLGFSDFTCPAKTAWEAALRQFGCISMAECPEERCQDRYRQQTRSAEEHALDEAREILKREGGKQR